MKFCTQQQILNWVNVTWSKMKKVALDRRRVRQNVFLVFLSYCQCLLGLIIQFTVFFVLALHLILFLLSTCVRINDDDDLWWRRGLEWRTHWTRFTICLYCKTTVATYDVCWSIFWNTAWLSLQIRPISLYQTCWLTWHALYVFINIKLSSRHLLFYAVYTEYVPKIISFYGCVQLQANIKSGHV